MSFLYTSANKASNVRCNLDVKRCTATNKTGGQCGRKTGQQLPFCTQHSKQQLGLEIKKSTIPGAGWGLFALKLFKKNDKIASYEGRKMTQYQIDEMYGKTKNDLAPYTVKQSRDKFLDGACSRPLAGFANNKPKHNNATLAVTSRTVNLKATKKIEPSKEIFTGYGRHYFTKPNDLPKPKFSTSKHKIENETEIPPKKPRASP